jgi:hypothetical protein
MFDHTTSFDSRITNLPEPWRSATVEVVDTAESICIALCQEVFGVANPAIDCPYLVAELTRLVLERVKADQQECTE